MNKLFSAVISTSDLCNLNCKYCYKKKGNSITTLNQIDKFLENMEKLGFNKSVTFFGGEPSLTENLIVHTIKNHPDLEYNMVSNGYFIFHNKSSHLLNFLHKFTITLEGTEKAYNFFRGENKLRDKINKLVQVKSEHQDIQITVNMSQNGLIFEDCDELIENYNILKNSGINVHFYGIKGENHLPELSELYNIFQDIKTKDRDLYLSLICYSGRKSDSNYLCTFDDSITLLSDGNIAGCSWDNVIGRFDDETVYHKIFEMIESHNKKYWYACENCKVNTGDCCVSCPSFILECINGDKVELLNKCCDFELFKEYLREMEGVV